MGGYLRVVFRKLGYINWVQESEEKRDVKDNKMLSIPGMRNRVDENISNE